MIPTFLLQAVSLLSIESPSDKKLAWHAIQNPEHCGAAAIPWLAGLVERGGDCFDDRNPLHLKQHSWPLTYSP